MPWLCPLKGRRITARLISSVPPLTAATLHPTPAGRTAAVGLRRLAFRTTPLPVERHLDAGGLGSDRRGRRSLDVRALAHHRSLIRRQSVSAARRLGPIPKATDPRAEGEAPPRYRRSDSLGACRCRPARHRAAHSGCSEITRLHRTHEYGETGTVDCQKRAVRRELGIARMSGQFVLRRDLQTSFIGHTPGASKPLPGTLCSIN